MSPLSLKASISTKSESVTRDDHFYLMSIYFKVEDCIFLVPRQHFETNEVFSTTFTLPPPGGQSVEGSSEENPFKLEGIQKEDFRALLSVLYPNKVPHDHSHNTFQEWISVLTLASMWEFQSLRDLAVQQLSVAGVLNVVNKIILGEKYAMHDWFIAGCVELVTRKLGPRTEEIQELGTALAVRIYDLRERRIEAQARTYSYSPRENVKKEFQDILGTYI